MNTICTWFYADEKGEESYFPQSGKISSNKSHQDIYWRCVIVFYTSSTRFNQNTSHAFFTNLQQLPTVDGISIQEVFDQLNVQIHRTAFKYKTPKGYYEAFQNQFFIFSILEYISEQNGNELDQFLVLDSDCVFLKSAADLFLKCRENGFLSFEIDSPVDHKINGLSRNDMQTLFQELNKTPIHSPPSYHIGEFFMANAATINLISIAFQNLWPVLLDRHNRNKLKLNEEAHTLSYLYYTLGLSPSNDKSFIRRIWTNPVFFRNVRPNDSHLAIWHLPGEKTFGFERLCKFLLEEVPDFGRQLTDHDFNGVVKKFMGIPNLTLSKKIEYYVKSYWRAGAKRTRKFINKLMAKVKE